MEDNPPTTAQLMTLYRYPVKGLSPEALSRVQLTKGCTLPFDRAYAIENGKGRFDPAQPKHLPKINFLMLMRNEKLARLKTRFDDITHELTIHLDNQRMASGILKTPEGCKTIETFMAGYMGDEIETAPHICHAPDHSFSDVSAKCLHIINLKSLRELERMMGQSIDPLRFRANLIIDGPQAFSELDWVGRRLTTGGIDLEVFKRTQRCPATNVDPEKGTRDRTIPDFLFKQFGHRDFGIYARVQTGGVLAENAELRLS